MSKRISDGLLRLVTQRCNSYLLPGSIREKCSDFYIGRHRVGTIRADHLKELLQYRDTFTIRDQTTGSIQLNESESSLDSTRQRGVTESLDSTRRVTESLDSTRHVTESLDSTRRVTESLDSYKHRTQRVNDVLLDLKQKSKLEALNGWRNEFYEVWANDRRCSLMKIERAAACIFGIRTYGVHINGYVNHSTEGLCVWTARRSPTKPTYPNKLDQMVAGGLTAGLTVLDCARKECGEEASIPEQFLNKLKHVGCVSYCYEASRGIVPGVEYCFDLELPQSFTPHNSDGEVADFQLLPVQSLLSKMITDEFRANAALVNLDFLIRHGIITPDNEPNYAMLVEWMHTTPCLPSERV
ncbi:uncharacterized protein LOC141914470 [Tubulanus polymorphus]|uniref:uncharacterized protein LOC141914470 n=1 Tax=Tubulanus polymorphus TaxID=672921 RepID=UPI003DA3D051